MWTKLDSLPELRAKTDDQIVKIINGLLVPTPSPNATLNAGDLAAAQFYMAELDRRATRRSEKALYRIETKRWVAEWRLDWLIVVLIGLELITAVGLAIWGDSRQTEDVQKQLNEFHVVEGNLKTLQQTSQSTADAMIALKANIEIMNRGLQEELGLNYQVILESDLDQKKETLNITNETKTIVYWFGFQSGSDSPHMYTKPAELHTGVPNPVDLSRIIAATVVTDTNNPPVVPLTFFLKNQRDEEFVGRVRLLVNKEHGQLGFSTSPIHVFPEKWSAKVGRSKAPSPHP